MAPSDGVTNFVKKYQALQARRGQFEELQKQEDTLIEDLILYCDNIENGLRQEDHDLKERLGNCCLDLAAESNLRRELQQQLADAERHMNFNPYVLVLIDGDGLLFQEQWINKGTEGGKQAARLLRDTVAAECFKFAQEAEIIAKVVANVKGLGAAMARDGCLDRDASVLEDFVRGFTQAKASFDFVDVGRGKERADSKIRELARWHLGNFNCKRILLGISHDAGYAPFLDEVLREENRDRITILQGVPIVKELLATRVHVLDLTERLFRSDKLVDRRAEAAAVDLSSPPATPTLPTPASYATAVAPRNASPPPKMNMPLLGKTKSLPSPSASASASPLLASKVAWNPGPRGADPPIVFNQQALDLVKRRRLCTNQYLRGACFRREACVFEHEHKASADEVVALAFLTKLSPCNMGQNCEIPHCVYGHNCPSVTDGWCTNSNCKFRIADHPPGTKFKNPRIGGIQY